MENNEEIPTGKCMNCGELLCNNEYFCDENCQKPVFMDLNGYYISEIEIDGRKYYMKEIKGKRRLYGLDRKNFTARSIKELNESTIKDIIE